MTHADKLVDALQKETGLSRVECFDALNRSSWNYTQAKELLCLPDDTCSLSYAYKMDAGL